MGWLWGLISGCCIWGLVLCLIWIFIGRVSFLRLLSCFWCIFRCFILFCRRSIRSYRRLLDSLRLLGTLRWDFRGIWSVWLRLRRRIRLRRRLDIMCRFMDLDWLLGLWFSLFFARFLVIFAGNLSKIEIFFCNIYSVRCFVFFCLCSLHWYWIA